MDSRRVIKVVNSGASELVQRVHIYDSVLDHIKESHQEEYQRIEEVYSTIEEPTQVYKSRTNPRSVVFINKSLTNTGGDPLRVPVKIMNSDVGIMTTAYFASSKAQGELLWSRIKNET